MTAMVNKEKGLIKSCAVRIFCGTLALLYFLVLLSPNNVQANANIYQGGLLDNKSISIMNLRNTGIARITNNLTDNNMDTGETISGQRVYYKFDTPTDVSQIRLDYQTTGATTLLQVFNSDGSKVYSTRLGYQVPTEVSLDVQAKKVSYIIFTHENGHPYTIHEFNVFGYSTDPGTGNPSQPDPGTGNPSQPDPGTGNPSQPDPGTGNPSQPDPGTENPSQPDPEQPSGNRAILVVTMTTGLEKEFDLSMKEVNDFIAWYKGKQAGSGSALYAINKHDNNKGPFSSRKDYMLYDRILTFEVSEYSK
ncbi:hypothetical protein ACT3XG_16125 [Paenibacillus polymyxa]|uniref:hypothetical protein n=1 Tax=Paenibacillus polymyxa TaxID=1406 RepID=UPI001CD608C4|nr:hypothetical protein [Paenibacillus polymyxa]UBS85672.1 hypothetical protein LAZ93_16070 [Paenibacillus polymyxa]